MADKTDRIQSETGQEVAAQNAPNQVPLVQPRPGLIANVLWNWLQVGLTLFAGLILTPFIIRKLGSTDYGIWSLVFSVTTNYYLLDFGVTTAATRFAAHFVGSGEQDKVVDLANTLLVYLLPIFMGIAALTWFLAANPYNVFRIPQEKLPDYRFVMIVVGISLGFALIANVWLAILEGLQRFDITSKIRVVAFSLRYFGSAVALYIGFGLKTMSVLVLISCLLLVGLAWNALQRVYHRFHLSLDSFDRKLLRETLHYGLHSLTARIGGMLSTRMPPLLIGNALPVQYVGYYSVAERLPQYAGDAVSRISFVISPRVSELAAAGKNNEITHLVAIANRYSFALFLPVVLFLLLYAEPFVQLWLRNDEYIAQSVPLIPIFLLAHWFASAGQTVTSGALFGIAKHKTHARLMLLESLVAVVLTYVLLPQFGLWAAAIVTSALFCLDRGVATPWLFCRYMQTPFLKFMATVHGRTLVLGFLLLLPLLWLRQTVLPGRTWLELAVAATLIAIICLVAGFFAIVTPHHRKLAIAKLSQLLGL